MAALRMNRASGLLALPLALAGCALGEPVSAGPAPAGPAERVAQALADADVAASAGEHERLARAVRIVDAAGARPLPDAGDDPLPGWRGLARDDSPPVRGSPLGPGYRHGRLEAGETARLQQLFLSGERAKIVVSAPDATGLTLRVRDSRDDTVCDRRELPGHCQWVPVFTERYSIEIDNRGAKSARYYLVIE